MDRLQASSEYDTCNWYTYQIITCSLEFKLYMFHYKPGQDHLVISTIDVTAHSDYIIDENMYVTWKVTKQENVDQWSTRIPLPAKAAIGDRNWTCQTGIVLWKFGVDMQSQTKVRVQKPKNRLWPAGNLVRKPKIQYVRRKYAEFNLQIGVSSLFLIMRETFQWLIFILFNLFLTCICDYKYFCAIHCMDNKRCSHKRKMFVWI